MENSRRKSCVQCRAAKARCSLATPHCLRCEKKRLSCKYEQQLQSETFQQVTPYHTWLAGTSSSEPQPRALVTNPMASSTNDNERNSEIPNFDMFSNMAADTIFPPGLDWSSDRQISIESRQPTTFYAPIEDQGDNIPRAQGLLRLSKLTRIQHSASRAI
jgi:hypothetical protein